MRRRGDLGGDELAAGVADVVRVCGVDVSHECVDLDPEARDLLTLELVVEPFGWLTALLHPSAW